MRGNTMQRKPWGLKMHDNTRDKILLGPFRKQDAIQNAKLTVLNFLNTAKTVTDSKVPELKGKKTAFAA